MADENTVENYGHVFPQFSVKDKYCGLEPATELPEQSMVSGMARDTSNETHNASTSANVISNVCECEDPASILENQNRNVKNMETHSVNGLGKDHSKTLSNNMEAEDDQRMSGRPYISSAGYHTCSLSDDGRQIIHFYPWNSDSESADRRPSRFASNSSKSKGFLSMTPNGRSGTARHNFLSISRVRSHQVPSSFGNSNYHSQHARQSLKDSHPDKRSPSPRSNLQCYGTPNKPWNNDGFTLLKDIKDSEVSKELICGPRAFVCGGDVTKKSETEEDLPYFSRRENFNLSDFQTEYENVKFYIIKSFGEDNVHKSVKYGAWSSTRFGNEKLDAAYQEAKTKGIETGKRCPIYLFFSVNGSGQFLGVCEMIGRVDFDRYLGFWQHDNWSGFFPVKWHILKDVPHSELRHIILKENDNRSVTYTRDAQEINLRQGIEMLNIFKNYSAKTSLLDDFFFYVNREKLREHERKNRLEREQPEEYESDRYRNGDAAGYGRTYNNHTRLAMTSVISRTRNLSLNSRSP